MGMKDKGKSKMGSGEYANMPQKEKFKLYPKHDYQYSPYNDNIEGIDEAMTESDRKRDRYPSKQK